MGFIMTDDCVKDFIHRIIEGDLTKTGLQIRDDKLPYINLPLYKYCAVCEESKRTPDTIDYNIDNFEKDILYFQNPANFNDPFDCFLGFSQSQIVKDILVREMKKKHQYTPPIKQIIDSLFQYTENVDEIIDENYDLVVEVIKSTFEVMNSDDPYQNFAQELVLSLAETDKQLFQRIIKNKMTIMDKKHIIDMMFDNKQYQSLFTQSIKSGNTSLIDITRREMKLKIENDPNSLYFENEKDDTSILSIILNLASILQPEQQSNDQLNNLKLEFDRLSKAALDKVRKIVSEQFKVTCLSERMDSPLMWSHYANKHYGFCLEYDFTATMTNLHNDYLLAQLMLFPVHYSNERPLISKTFFSSKTKLNYIKNKQLPPHAIDELVYGLLGKSLDWNYEKEWRILQVNDKDTMKLCKPQKLFLGVNIEPTTKERLIEIANKKKIPVFQMCLKPDNYQFDYYRIL